MGGGISRNLLPYWIRVEVWLALKGTLLALWWLLEQHPEGQVVDQGCWSCLVQGGLVEQYWGSKFPGKLGVGVGTVAEGGLRKGQGVHDGGDVDNQGAVVAGGAARDSAG